MRILDLVRLYEDGTKRVLDEAPGSIDIRRYLLLSEDVAYERGDARATAPIDAGTMALTIVGPDQTKHADEAGLASLVDRLEPGARAVVFFAWAPDDLPYHRFLDPLTAHRCQVLQVAAIDTETIRAAAVIERVDDLVAPRNALGDVTIPTPPTGEDGIALRLRLANEFAFADFASRHLRAAMRERTEAIAARDENLAFRTKLAEDVKQRDARIAQLKAQVARVEGSTSMKLGKTLIGAARSPKALFLLPRDLVRLWRGRGHR
jgi:hypothetical protein